MPMARGPARARIHLARAAQALGHAAGAHGGARARGDAPERVVERAREYVARGVAHFIGMFGRVEDLRGARRFAERVLPTFAAGR